VQNLAVVSHTVCTHVGGQVTTHCVCVIDLPSRPKF